MLSKKYKAIFFDLDGTLIDSAKDLSVAIDIMATELSIPSPSLEKIKLWIGNGTLKLVERVLIDSNNIQPSPKELEHAFNLFSQSYSEIIGEHSCLYPNVKELFVKLLADNIKIACITNKPYEFTDFLLQQNFIRQFFSVVCAGDNVKHRKPNPWPLLYSANKFNFKINDCLMIGEGMESSVAIISIATDKSFAESIKVPSKSKKMALYFFESIN